MAGLHDCLRPAKICSWRLYVLPHDRWLAALPLNNNLATLMKTPEPTTTDSPLELRATFAPRPQISHVLFDFDGTLSLVRQGWSEVMIGMFVEVMPSREGETADALRQLVIDDIMSLNGKQTIFQMIRLAERIQERGGTAEDPLWYKHEYLRRLDIRIKDRLVGLEDGSIPRDELLVFGSRAFLDRLVAAGLTLYLASGTDDMFVKREAKLLDVDHYFVGRIYGAVDAYKSFSKKIVIDNILRDHNIPGSQLLAFGDGFVEIQNTKEVGGLAVAVASDEAANGSGRVDPWKRERLIGVGADVVIPDYRAGAELLSLVFGK